MRTRDVLMWIVSVAAIVVVQRFTGNNGWGNDIWVGVIAATFAVGLGVMRRNRRLGR
jgi:hypothetical protein